MSPVRGFEFVRDLKMPSAMVERPGQHQNVNMETIGSRQTYVSKTDEQDRYWRQLLDGADTPHVSIARLPLPEPVRAGRLTCGDSYAIISGP